MSFLFDFEDSIPEYPLYSEEELDFYDFEDYEDEEEDEDSGSIGILVLSDDSMDDDRFLDEPDDLDYGLIEDMNDYDASSDGGDFELNL